LVAEGAADVQASICNALSAAGYHLVEATDGPTALEVCRRERPDLVLLDIDSPLIDGHATLRQIRADADLDAMPVLFLTARTDGESAVTGLALAAQTYVQTPCGASELIARVDTALRTKATVARQVRETDELATIDVLTGLASRRRMETRILELAARHGPDAVATVVLVAVDDFKAFSDAFGYALGDIVMQITARRLEGALGDERVVVCRWGEGEFLAAGVGLDSTEARELAERMRQSISATPFGMGIGHPIPMTVSGGCASGRLARYAAVLEAAQEALYEATRSGRDRILVADGVSPD
jgi:diguanylate cyclase (GGDEF)-like protein